MPNVTVATGQLGYIQYTCTHPTSTHKWRPKCPLLLTPAFRCRVHRLHNPLYVRTRQSLSTYIYPYSSSMRKHRFTLYVPYSGTHALCKLHHPPLPGPLGLSAGRPGTMADPYAIKPEPGTGRSVAHGAPWPAHIPRRVPTLLQALPKLVTASWLKVRNDEDKGAYEQVWTPPPPPSPPFSPGSYMRGVVERHKGALWAGEAHGDYPTSPSHTPLCPWVTCEVRSRWERGIKWHAAGQVGD